MTDLTSWLSPAVMHSLGWALLHFLWQGTAIAAIAAAAMSLSRVASIRYAIGVGALSLMLAVPVATFFFLGQTRIDEPRPACIHCSNAAGKSGSCRGGVRTGNALSSDSVARSIGVARGSLVAWRGFFQPAIGGGIPV